MPSLPMSYSIRVVIFLILLLAFTLAVVKIVSLLRRNYQNEDGFFDDLYAISKRIDRAKTEQDLIAASGQIQELYTTFQATRFYSDIHKEATVLLSRLQRRQSVLIKK